MNEIQPAKDRILRIAMGLFARKGYDGASMREIAEAAEVTKAALYYHFPDKNTLFCQAMASTHEYLNGKVEAAVAGIEDPVHRLQAAIHARLGLFHEEGDLIRAFYVNLFIPEERPAGLFAAIQAQEKCQWDALQEVAEAGLAEPDRLPELHTLLIGGIEYLGSCWLLDDGCPEPTAEAGDQLLATLIPAIADRLKPSTADPVRRQSQGKERC